MPSTSFSALAWLDELLDARLDPSQRAWLTSAAAEIAAGVDGTRFGSLLSLASRHVPARPAAPDGAALGDARQGLPGWNPERLDLREAARMRLVLARTDQEQGVFAEDLESAFRFADEGELRALYKTLPLLPDGARFAWRAGEGCRTNIVPVFEALACDSPYPVRHLDDIAWNQLVIKALFIGAPLWRVHGLDGRLSEDLARMALDLAEERRSAGRPVQVELWLTLGRFGGERALESMERERASGAGGSGDTISIRAVELAALRRKHDDWVQYGCDQTAFRAFDPRQTP
jgi:hypothetical protein